jgi:subtilisin family serine protease
MMNGGRMSNGFASRVFMAAIAVVGLSVHAQQSKIESVPGEYVVKLRPSLQGQTLSYQSKMLNAIVKETVSAKLGLVLVQRPIIQTAASVINSLSANPAVEYAEPNYIYRVVGGAATAPTDPEFGRLWGLNNTGQATEGDMGNRAGLAGNDIAALEAWKMETGSKDIVVAVIDTGVDYNNPDLAPNIYTNMAELNGQAGVDDDGNGYIDDIHGYDFAKDDGDPMDVYGHGTHVSGTIGASANNDSGIVGVAWNVTIVPVRFLDDNGGGTLANAIKSIDYATAMHVNIMSNSWGGGGFSQAMMDSITAARDAGILFTAAAGNNGSDNDKYDFYPAGYQLENVLSVAAIGPSGELAYFSNYGKTKVHVAAPGVNILSYTTNGLQSWSGTSMATPHVTGIAVLMMSADRTLTFTDIKNRLISTSQPRDGLKDKLIANGIVSAHYALMPAN